MPTQLSPGLERLEAFLSAHNNPQDKPFNIHVAGTNGKGSVVTIVEECLRRAGILTGRYTGPHLLNWTERIQTNGQEISEIDFANLLDSLKSSSERFSYENAGTSMLTWFELITAMAFFYFQKQNIHTAVLEVGLGGRWDATNTIHTASVSAIVSVGLDHMQILGDTIGAIAAEKAEIIKDAVPAVTGCTGEALQVIREVSLTRKAPLLSVRKTAERSFEICGATGLAGETELAKLAEDRLREIGLQQRELKLGYQQHNALIAAVVLAVYENRTGLKCLEYFIEAIENFFWPGRLQYFPSQRLLLDGAHNEAGAIALRSTLDELFPKKKINFILSFYRTKQFEKILSAFLRPGDRVWASQTGGRRAVISSEEIAKAASALAVPSHTFPSIERALEAALSSATDEHLSVATGSFASVAAGLNFLGYQSVEASRSACTPLFV